MSKKQILFFIFLVLIPALFFWLNVMELRSEEPRRAIVSLEMLLTGEWIVPHINGWAYYNKPPFFNWLMAFFFWLFGSFEEWVVRFPSLLSACIHAFLIYHFSKKYISKNAAILAGLIYITSGEILFFGAITSGEIDLFFSLITFLQLWSIFHFHEKKAYSKMFLLSYLLVSIGLLTKGLPSLAFQALTLLAYTAYKKTFKILFSPAHFLGIGLFAALCGSYFYAFSLQDDLLGFAVRQYKEAAMRTGLETDTKETFFGVLLFIPKILKLMAPWSLLLLFAFRKPMEFIRKNPLLLFSLIFAIVNLPLYWISGDFKARYYYVFMAFFSILLAALYEENKVHLLKMNAALRMVFIVIAALIPFACVLAFFIEIPLNITHIPWRISLLLLLSGISTYILFRSKEWIFAFVLVLAIARIGFNLFYLPAWQADKSLAFYRESTAEMLEISQNKAIYFYGNSYTFSSDVSFGPIHFTNVNLTTAPLIIYRIPYYLSRQTREVMKFETALKPNTFYLAPTEMFDSNRFEILYRIHDTWVKRDYVLFETSADVSSDFGNNTNQ